MFSISLGIYFIFLECDANRKSYIFAAGVKEGKTFIINLSVCTIFLNYIISETFL